MKFSVDRIEALRKGLVEAAIDVALVGPSADMFYLIGGKLPLTERLALLVIPLVGRPSLVVPKLQVPLVERLVPHVRVIAWNESDDPLELVAEIVREAGSRRVAVNGQLWANSVLGLQQRLPGLDFHDVSPILSVNRKRKDPAEIEKLWDLGSRFDAIWDSFFSRGKLVGETEHAVAAHIRELTLAQGFESVLWCDVGSGPNGASPLHHGSSREIEAGDPVVIDFAGVLDGYVMDSCRTPIAGEPPDEFVSIYNIVNRAYEAAADTVRPGVAAQDVDWAARRVIADAGYGPQFLHRLGHGLGIDAHEEPYIVQGNLAPLEAGMVFSNEPGIYVPGRWGVRIENILLVTETGSRSFNEATRLLVSMS